MQDDPLSIAVVTKIAELEGVDPTELTPPLHNVIDPTALDKLFHRKNKLNGSSGVVQFTYNGYKITVRSDGDIQAKEVDQHSESQEQTSAVSSVN